MVCALVLAHGLSYGGAQVSTLETLRHMRNHIDRIYVAVSDSADTRFVADLKALGLTPVMLPCRIDQGYPDLQIAGISDTIRETDFVWISDDAYLSAPKIKRISNVPIVCHLRNYALLCLMWGACYNFQDAAMQRCTLPQAVRCKQNLNDELSRLGQMSYARSTIFRLLDYAKGPLDYYRWPLRRREITECMDGFVSVSKATLEIHKHHLPVFKKRPSEVIYDPFSIPVGCRSVSVHKQEVSSNRRPTALYTAYNTTIPKGPHIYLQAVKLLLNEGAEIDARMLGCKDTWVENYARKLSIHDHVTFFSKLDSIAAVYRLMADSSVVVVPSVWPEPLPRVAIEANLMGVPVVCSKIGGLPEVIFDGENGFLAKPGSAEDFADKMRRALTTHFSAKRIAELAKERFDPETQVERLVDFILTL